MTIRQPKRWPPINVSDEELKEYINTLTRELDDEFTTVFVEIDNITPRSGAAVTIISGNTDVTVSNAITETYLTTITTKVMVTPTNQNWATFAVSVNYNKGHFIISRTGGAGTDAIFDWVVLPTQYV